MAIDAHQASILLKWMSKHFGGANCPLCKSENSLRANKTLCSLPTYEVSSRTVKIDHGIPIAVISCAECGHVELVAANIIGMVARGDSAKLPQIPNPEAQTQKLHSGDESS